MTTPATRTERRAEASLGTSSDPIYRLVARTIATYHSPGGLMVDVGCGVGRLWSFTRDSHARYIGADVIRHEGFPEAAEFRAVDLDAGRVDLPDGSADVVACVETIEHVENPRALVRELHRLARPGGLIVVTTPNQLSLLSVLGLVLKGQFPAFQDRPGLYPAHLTALLPIDLVRIATEVGLIESQIAYSNSGRIPGTAWHWPRFLRGRAFSDNVLLATRRPPLAGEPDPLSRSS